MSTSLLYHGFGMRDYRYVKTEFSDGGVIFTVRRNLNRDYSRSRFLVEEMAEDWALLSRWRT